MIISLSDAAELKKGAKERLSSDIHFHDGCGGQFFTIDAPTAELKQFIIDFFASRKIKVFFSENGEYFTVEEIK